MTERPSPNPEKYAAWKKEQGVTPEFEENVREGLHNTIEVDLAELDVRASEELPLKPKLRPAENPATPDSRPGHEELREVLSEYNKIIAQEAALLNEYKSLDPSFSIEIFQRTTETNPWKIKYDRTKPSHQANSDELREKAGILRGLIEDMVKMNESLKQNIARLKSARR